MKAAIVTSAGTKPIFGEFDKAVLREGFEVITVTAAALTNLTRGRAAGSHYSADNHYPFVPGVDGVGTLTDGRRVYFAMPEAPFGAMAEQTLSTRTAPSFCPTISTMCSPPRWQIPACPASPR